MASLLQMLGVLLLLVVFKGIKGTEYVCTGSDNPMVCFAHLEKSQMKELIVSSGPTVEVLLRVCPDVKKFVDCRIKDMEACRNLDEEGNSKKYQDMLEVKDFVNEFCNESSPLHQAFARNADCFTGLLDKFQNCSSTANEKFHMFLGYLEDVDDETTRQVNAKLAMCASGYLAFGCFAVETLRTCGSEAMDTVVEILTRAKVHHLDCPPELVLAAQAKYFDFLTSDANSEVEFVDM